MRWLLTVCATLAVVFSCAVPAAAWVDPTSGLPYATRVTRSADIPEHNWLPGHRGVDLALSVGRDVVAAGEGTVAFAGVVAGTPVVSIDHPGGIRTTYQPVHAVVAAGDSVLEGEVIGRLGHSPPTPAGHDGLHWGARTGKDTYIDPLSLLEVPTIRLKPVEIKP